jgi:hypothetical protein
MKADALGIWHSLDNAELILRSSIVDAAPPCEAPFYARGLRAARENLYYVAGLKAATAVARKPSSLQTSEVH